MGLGSTIRQWQANWAQAHELDALDKDHRDALARDIGVPAEMLPALVERGAIPQPNCRASWRRCPLIQSGFGRSMPLSCAT
jgi:hypothetical protein